MSRNRRFDSFTPYLLTDQKEGVFVNEPAMCVGKRDSDMERPTLCALCGEPLGSNGCYSFYLTGPNGYGKDMRIGNGCAKNRLKAQRINITCTSFKETWRRVIAKFPNNGRWYGTFLHNCIAKPYVKNSKAVESWDESILNLPGVKYIMKVVDYLRDQGYMLDAEMVLENGRVDLLATHPEKGTIVYDWKSDKCFDNHYAYVNQVNKYMVELNEAGFPKISGYLLWIMDERRERVPFDGTQVTLDEGMKRMCHPSLPIKCTLTIELNGGEGLKKKMIEYSHHHIYGDEVSFYIPPSELSKKGYEFRSFEASPYREDQHPQWKDAIEVEEGFPIRFICTKKRHSFSLVADWKRIRPFECFLLVRKSEDNSGDVLFLKSRSKVDSEGNDYVDFEVNVINEQLHNERMIHASLLVQIEPCKMSTSERTVATTKEWSSEDLYNGAVIRIPCIGEQSSFCIIIETEVVRTKQKTPHKKIDSPHIDFSDAVYDLQQLNQLIGVDETITTTISEEISLDPVIDTYNPAEYSFTPGRIYKSGDKFYGVYKRRAAERNNTCGKVDVAEVDVNGRKISNFEWRHVYMTKSGKEFIYGLTNRDWKIYTRNVLAGVSPEGMERYGNMQ